VVAPGFEIPDSRIKNWYPRISINELISDNAVTGKVVVGKFMELNNNISWPDIKADLFMNDRFVSTGRSSNVLSNPLCSIKWLQQSLIKNGKKLQVGMVISSGTFIKPIKLEQGMYKAVFESFGELTLRVI
jgi:2-keto-4-pentenoate hydratase